MVQVFKQKSTRKRVIGTILGRLSQNGKKISPIRRRGRREKGYFHKQHEKLRHTEKTADGNATTSGGNKRCVGGQKGEIQPYELLYPVNTMAISPDYVQLVVKM